MIKTEHEYLEAKKRLEEEFKTLEQHKVKMKKAGLSKEQAKLALNPLTSFAMQLQEEVDDYEKLKRGQFDPLENLNGIGHMLVALRISKGIKQKDLAAKMNSTESQVSRDERNEYHGASIEKIQKVLKALGATLKSQLDVSFRDTL